MLKNLRANPIAVGITCGTTALLWRSSDRILKSESNHRPNEASMVSSLRTIRVRRQCQPRATTGRSPCAVAS